MPPDACSNESLGRLRRRYLPKQGHALLSELARPSPRAWCAGSTSGFTRARSPSVRRAVGWFAGVAAGLTIPGRQDLKLKKHNERGDLTNYLFSQHVDAADGPIASVYAGLWSRGAWGVQLDLSYWRTETEPEHFVNRGPPAAPMELPPFGPIAQHRISTYLTGLYRFPVPGDGSLDPAKRFLYVGAGIGPVYTKVDYGHTGWNWAFQFLVGASLPVTHKDRLRLEFRYMVAPDADSPARAEWRADTSGTGMFPGFAHKDTRFFTLLLGYEHHF